ncbi:MAG TPA: hypothetical protein VG370_12565 [Chloroflexota bacterium]|nr:hypothetical protein [Chloroflexota bacterium]
MATAASSSTQATEVRETDEQHRGLSVWERAAKARDFARWQLRKGLVARAYVAAVRLEEGGSFWAEPSPPPTGHWTLWGDPDALAAASWIVERLGE